MTRVSQEVVSYRKIVRRIWTDKKFRKLSEKAKLLTFYLITSDQTNRIGIYNFSPAKAAEELEWTQPVFSKIFKEVLKSTGWEWDDEARVIFIRSWWNHNEPDHLNAFKGYLKDLHSVADTPLIVKFVNNHKYLTKEHFIEHLVQYGQSFTQSFGEALPKALPKALAITETETETDTETTPPTPPPKTIGPEDLLDAYNENNQKLPTPEVLSPERKKRCRSRITEGAKMWGSQEKYLEMFSLGIRMAQDSSFMCGERETENGKKPWRADFSWFIANNDNLLKTIEGNYSDHLRPDADVVGAIGRAREYFGDDAKDFPEANEKDKELWNKIRTQLQGRINGHQFEVFFDPVRIIRFNQETKKIEIGVPNAHFRNWIMECKELSEILESTKLKDYEILCMTRSDL